MSLHRLVYYSASRMNDSDPSFNAEIEQILASSRRNNQIAGLTGALMFSSGHFGQVLEGSPNALEATFERIQQDMRHGNVTLLSFDPVLNRAFETWAMAYVGCQSGLFTNLGPLLDDTGLLGDQVYARLRSLVASER